MLTTIGAVWQLTPPEVSAEGGTKYAVQHKSFKLHLKTFKYYVRL